MLSWDHGDDWDDHLATPKVAHRSDAMQCARGPQVPLLMFGGPVAAVSDSRWHSHVAITRILLQLLGLPALGCPCRSGPRPARAGQRPPRHTAPRAALAGARVSVLQAVAVKGPKGYRADLALVRLRRRAGIEDPQ
jgi:hypothetical protein